MKKNEIMSFETIWMDLEVIILSEVSQRQISYDITYMWNLKKKKKRYNELTYKTEIDSQYTKQTYSYQRGNQGKER